MDLARPTPEKKLSNKLKFVHGLTKFGEGKTKELKGMYNFQVDLDNVDPLDDSSQETPLDLNPKPERK